MIKINIEKCIQCEQCIPSCSFGALVMQDGYPEVNEACVGCNQCIKACPVDAIAEQGIQEKKEDFLDYKDVWVIAETDPITNKLCKVTLELLSQGRKIADQLKQRLGTVILCQEVPPNVNQLIGEVGSDFALVVKNSLLSEYNSELYAQCITELVYKHKPSIIFMAASETGRDLAPRISAKLQTGLTADCTGFDLDQEGNLIQIRPTYGGSVMASIITPNHRPQMASVRPNVFTVEKLQTPHNVEIFMEDISLDENSRKIRITEIKENPNIYKNVAESEVVIVAGYGVGSKENLKVIQRLAQQMGAALGVTRKVVDEGWAPFELQVGQTGKTIAPDLYISFGVSGALQHTIGIRNAKYVIAVNNDPAALIFNMCNQAILGDCMKVAEEMLCEINKRR